MSLILAVIGILFIPIETLTALSLANLQVMGRYFVILIFGVFYLAELLAAVIGNHLSMTTVQHVTHQNIDN
ncbi:hypothetical protein [Photobacterium phosphoreum]|uniref:hypothetical protein n=1 Tax=Photobacterium phosphoreum TaxID=659 RepID=UPI0011B2979A|nr:hypothetical protein [Photobacterium phosphoreum]